MRGRVSPGSLEEKSRVPLCGLPEVRFSRLTSFTKLSWSTASLGPGDRYSRGAGCEHVARTMQWPGPSPCTSWVPSLGGPACHRVLRISHLTDLVPEAGRPSHRRLEPQMQAPL